MEQYILVLDQGTTGSRAIVFDHSGQVVSQVYEEFQQYYPEPAWVEHDPLEIWECTLGVMKEAMAQAGLQGSQIAALGITNQRETTTIWDKNTGVPVYNSIVWGDRRTSDICQDLYDRGLAEGFNAKTGLVVDPVYSATKIKWILDNVSGVRDRAENGELLFGTIDTWLIWKLTGGEVHATDYSNASRTMLFNVHEVDWDDGLLHAVQVPRHILPEARESVGDFGKTAPNFLDGARVPITGVAGDQQAALFGQACFEVGMAKNTYGTSCVPLMFIGDRPVASEKGLLTLAWGIDGRVEFAQGASIFTAGAAIQWLRDGLGVIKSAQETEAMAQRVPDTGGVYFVPAFVGLGAPHWDMYARGAIMGITGGTTSDHVARATLESLAYQTKDLLVAMERESGIGLKVLKVDGGAVKNEFLMQFQADILGVPVVRPVVTETTSLGAAYMAGLGVGFWQDQEEIAAQWKAEKTFEPQMSEDQRQKLYQGWLKAVERVSRWAAD